MNYQVEKDRIILISSAGFTQFSPPKDQPLLTLQWNCIPDDLFEWKSTFRKSTTMVILGLS
jgi:hypothetical protein